MDNAQGHVYNLRTLGNVTIRLAMVKKGFFWGFVAHEGEKEEKKNEIMKNGEPAKHQEHPKKEKDKNAKEVRPPKFAFKKPKVAEEDEVVQIKPICKAPRSTMLQKEDDDDDEDPSVDKHITSSSGSGSSSSLSSGTSTSSSDTDSPF